MLELPVGLTQEECNEIHKKVIQEGMTNNHFVTLFLGLIRTATSIAISYGKDSENISIAYSAVMRALMAVPADKNLRAYVCRSIHNALISSKRHPHISLDSNPAGRFYDLEYIDVKDTIKALSESRMEQQYLEMRLEGYSKSEIANILNVSKSKISQLVEKIETRYVEKFGRYS